jgi:hypothetical protein
MAIFAANDRTPDACRSGDFSDAIDCRSAWTALDC